MRKSNPQNVRDDFAAGLADIASFYATAHAAISRDRDRTFLAESTLISTAVLWEGYVSDLFLAYINRDAGHFAEHLQNALNEALEGKPRRILDTFGPVTIPAHLTKAVIEELMDPRGSNLTFRNSEELRDGAARYLTPAHRAGIEGLNDQDQKTIDALIAVRNHLAHRSGQSHNTMNQVLALGALHPTGLQRGVRNLHLVGPWLKARPTPQQSTRVEIFLARIGAIAAAI